MKRHFPGQIGAMCLAGLLGLAPVRATSAPVGSEFQVNTYTTAHQQCPAVAALANGEFVVVWDSLGSTGDDDSTYSIQARRFGKDGTAIGSDFQVNDYTFGFQILPDVSGSPDGSFVVVWAAPSFDGPSEDAVLGRRFQSDGEPIGGDFQANSYTTDDQKSPAVSVNEKGEFLVVWYGENFSDQVGIAGRAFASTGDPIGLDFEINTSTIDQQLLPDVAALSDGSFVVVWYSGPNLTVKARRVSKEGPLGDEFSVSSLDSSVRPTVAGNWGGGFTATWDMTPGIGDAGTGIAAQRFDSIGTPSAPAFGVNFYTTSQQFRPRIASDRSGRSFITWLGQGRDGDATSSQGRFVDESGAVGPEFVVNTYTTGDQYNSVVAWSNAGQLLVVWQSTESPEDDSGFSLRARVVDDPYFISSARFENGDLSEWDLQYP